MSGAEIDELAMARRILRFGWDIDPTPYKEKGIVGLNLIEANLGQRPFLAGAHPTVADMACFPFVAMADEANIDMNQYPNILAWVDRIQQMDGFIPLPRGS